jgi:hypothetical protein
VKNGFSNSDLKHEIEFRNRKDLPSFVPKLIEVTDNGYSEVIIDGKPLARIWDEKGQYRDMAFGLICNYRKSQTINVDIKTYKEKLKREIYALISRKVKQKEALKEVVLKLLSIPVKEEIPITFSHGDLQQGNIWIENETNKIYIIDWESWGIRSIWYDKAVLYHNLRPGGLHSYLAKQIEVSEQAIVLLEDIVFHLKELNNLPNMAGEELFDEYLITLTRYF